MPDFLTIKRQHDAAKLKGLMSQDSSLADFAKLGALATDDPSYQQVAESPAWKNMIRGWSANIDEAVQSGPVDDWTAEAFGFVGDLFGVTPEASRAAGRELPRQVLNFLPMAAGAALGSLAGPAGTATGAKVGLGLTSGLSALDAYGKGGTATDAIIGGVSPYVGGKLSEFGSKAALRSAATPGSFLNRAGFMKGKDVLNPATHTITDAATGLTKQVLGETVDTFRDKALGYVAGETLANVGFTGLDIVQQGPDAVLNKDYLFANLASNIPFMAADIPNFTKTRFAWEPTDAPLVPTREQINAEKTRGERTRESLEAIDNNLAKFQREAELGVDVGRFIDKNNQVAATMEGHRKAITLEAETFKSTWNKLREVNSALPDVLTGIDPKALLQNPSVISFDPAKAEVLRYQQSLKQINKVKDGNLSRIAKSDADLDRVMGLVEEDLRLPETLLSTPVAERAVEQYQKALGTKLSDNAVKLIRMKHMEIAQGENFVPEFPKLWEEYQKTLTGKFEGSIDDRYELITASLLATGKFPKVVKAQKKIVKQAAKEGLTKTEAAKVVNETLATEVKVDELKKAVDARIAAAKAVAEPVVPAVEKSKGGRPVGPTKETVDKNAAMEERIVLAGKALKPTDEDRFFIIASQMIDPANRAKGLNWMSKVATEHAPLPLAQKLLKFQSGLKTLDDRVEASNQLKTVPLNEEITPDAVAEMETALEEADSAAVPAREEAMQELIVEETARELDEDVPEISQTQQEQNLARDFMVAMAKKVGVELSPADAAIRFANMPLSVREKNLALAKMWKEKGFPQLAAKDIDPLTVHFTTGQPLPIKEFATAWAREAGVPEAEIPATVDDFVRITQMFSAGEARFGKLEGNAKREVLVSPEEFTTIPEDLTRAQERIKTIEDAKRVDLSQPVGAFRDITGKLRLFDGHHRWLAAKMLGKKLKVVENAQFARASAGAFDFGMREVKNGQIQRPGKPPLGTKDGWMTELDFRNNGGELGPLQKDEVAFYKQLVPEAFADGKVHLQKLWDGLGKVGEQVKVVTYGQDGQATPEKARSDELHHIWWENLTPGQQDTYNLVMEQYNEALTPQQEADARQQLLSSGFASSLIPMGLEYHNLGVKLARAEANYSGPRATSYYNQISPFDTKKFPVVRVDVVLPIGKLKGNETSAQLNAAGDARKPLWRPDGLHENLPNTLGWAMVQIVPHPVTGEKVMFVGEAQSRWGQQVQKLGAKKNIPFTNFATWAQSKGLTESQQTKLWSEQSLADPVWAEWRKFADDMAADAGRPQGHLLLPIHQNLILKAVIKEAQKQGISKVAVSDGETAMMTEGHDKAADSVFRIQPTEQNLQNARKRNDFLVLSVLQDGKAFELGPKTEPKYRQDGYKLIAPEPSQAGGMRLAYDTTMPSIMSKLVGEGKMEDFGVHKNARVDFNRATALGPNAAPEEFIQGSPVFRNPDGTPKTNVTARVFDISNPADRLNTLFAQGGTIYGAAFKDIAQAFFSTKAFQGPNKTKAMGYVLAHEMGHIAFGKAMRGEYGQETKQIFDEAIAWVKTNDPAVLRDVEEVIRELYLPKEFKDLNGVKDVLGNVEGEEWLANAHAMMVTGAVNASKPVKALLILPKVIREAVENTIRRVQDGLRHARMYWKLSGDKDKMNQVLRVKDMMDSVRKQFREAEWQTAQAVEFLNTNPANLLSRMNEVRFARSPYGADTVKSKIGGFFNNATQGLGDFMATYKSFQEPGLKLLHAERSIKGQVAESLTPIFGRQGATGNIVVDKSMPWFKLANSKPLYELVKKINLEAQDSNQSVIVQNPDGTISFNWAAMTPESRATVKLHTPENQKAMAQFLIQKEQSTKVTQKNNVQHETAYTRAFVGNLIAKMKSFDAGSAPDAKFKEARVVMGQLFDAVQSGDQAALQSAMKRFGDPNEAKKVVELVQDRQAKIQELAKFYAERPNFQSLRRFKPIIQHFTDANGENKVLDFNKPEEAKAMRAELEAKGWKAQGDPIIRDFDKRFKSEFTLDSKMVDLLEGKEGRLKAIINSMDLDPVDRDALLGESSFLADMMREVKSKDLYLPGVKRRISGGPEHLDMLEQHLTYTQAAHKVGYMKALGEEIKYFMNSPELKDQLREKQQFLEFYNQAKSVDPKFWRMVNKANAVWHIGFNLPGHLAELFQPVQTHIHEAVAQGHSMLTALKTTVGAEKSAMAAVGKLIKSKVGYHDSEAIWEHWGDKDEADMLKTNWPRNLQQPLQEVYQQVGVNQETLRAIVEEREMLTPSKVLTKGVNMYGNTAMGLYSVFTQHNALVGLLTGYRLAKKKGLSHAEAVKQAELFELAVNNSAGKLERPAYFNKLGDTGYVVYALSSYVRGRFSQLARYYRHGFDKVNFPELNQNDRRAARKAFATMISGQLAAAGILGFPFIGAGIALMEDLTGEELKGQGLDALNEMTDDPLLTQALSYGVVSSMAESLGIPADLHSRFALGGFLGINAYDGVSAASVLGPTASMINSMWKMGKTLAQEKDLGAAFRAGGPGGVKRMAEALSEEFQAENPDANLPMAMAGFRSGAMFKRKEMERIISKTNEAAQRDVQIAAKRVEESLLLGPEVAQRTLMREANALIDQSLTGRGRQVALKDMMSNLRQRIALAKVKKQMPSDIRGKATAQTASKISNIAQAIGYQPPPAQNVEQEQIMRQIYAQLGAQRSPGSLRRAQMRQAELQADPGMFY